MSITQCAPVLSSFSKNTPPPQPMELLHLWLLKQSELHPPTSILGGKGNKKKKKQHLNPALSHVSSAMFLSRDFH